MIVFLLATFWTDPFDTSMMVASNSINLQETVTDHSCDRSAAAVLTNSNDNNEATAIDHLSGRCITRELTELYALHLLVAAAGEENKEITISSLDCSVN